MEMEDLSKTTAVSRQRLTGDYSVKTVSSDSTVGDTSLPENVTRTTDSTIVVWTYATATWYVYGSDM